VWNGDVMIIALQVQCHRFNFTRLWAACNISGHVAHTVVPLSSGCVICYCTG